LAKEQVVSARERQGAIGLRRPGDFGEDQRERVFVDIFGEMVEGLFETCGHIDILFLQGIKETHKGAPRVGARIRGRAETDLASDDGRPEVAFGEVVFSRDLSVLCPMIEAMSVIQEEILNVSDPEVQGGSLDRGEDLGFGFGGFLIKLGIADGLVSETDGGGQQRGEDVDKGFDFC
jgi:hypothetical protein